MNGYIITENANNVFYAYYHGRFWRWDDVRNVWKESHLMAEKYERAKAALATLTPEDFLTNSAEFTRPDEYELDFTMLDALKDAKPCKTAPIEPVKDTEEPCKCSVCTCSGCKEECFGNCHRCGHPVQDCNSFQTGGEKHLQTTKEDAECQTSTPDVSLLKRESVPSDQNVDTSSASDELLPNGGNTSAAVASAASQCCAAAPTFDFGADDQTNALLLQDAQTFITGNMARIMAAKHAHDLCANHYKGTWGKWCTAVGISRDTGDRMVSVAAQCGNIQLEGKSILDVQPLKLLYAAVKPSTPETVKQAVFSGDITTYKEYQDLMAQLKEKDAQLKLSDKRIDELQAHSDKLTHDYNDEFVKRRQAESELDETRARLKSACIQEQESFAAMNAANARADKAESNYNAALADVTGLQEQYSQMSQRAQKAESDLRAAKECYTVAKKNEDYQCKRIKELQEENHALKKQPIVSVVDEEEVDRRAHQQAYAIAADMTADFQAEKEQDARNAYDSILRTGRSIDNIWQTVKPLFRKMPAEQREDVANQLIHTLATIQAEVSKCL